jgi:hypothetical protein
VFRSLLNDGGQVSTPAVFSDDVEDVCILVNTLINIFHDVFVMEVLEDVAIEDVQMKKKMKEWIRDDTYTSVAICFLSSPRIFSKLISLHAKICGE